MMKRTLVGMGLLCFGAAATLTSCSSQNTASNSKGVSSKTGWNYNDKTTGGYEVANYAGQQTGPGLKFIEGGRFTMGQTEDDGMQMDGRNNIPRTVSVSSFYMDETEVANVDYREYIYWLTRAYGSDYPDQIQHALPDTSVWRSPLSYNEPMVNNYFRHAAYNFYPVVGVNWYQANEYCKWRSDRVNELILVKNGILKKNVNQVNEDVYTTETYLYGQYDGTAGKSRRKDLDPNGSGRRNAGLSDGYFLPSYRLPTEAEWEYAAAGLVGNNPEPGNKKRRGEEVFTNRNTYPWGDPNSIRSGYHNQYQGEIQGNITRGNGDAMGTPGGLNDNADYPAPVYSYAANTYGLYNMAGNVSEWTLDTYRPTSHQYENELNPFQGNVYETYKRVAEDNSLDEKDSLGYLQKRALDSADLTRTPGYYTKKSDIRGYGDGDQNVSSGADDNNDATNGYSYQYGKTTLVSNDTKIYKGASWHDRAYWMSPGTRRFMLASKSSATVGFRCVMPRLGSPNGDNSQQAGNMFGKGAMKSKTRK